jgi:hypothetical protein
VFVITGIKELAHSGMFSHRGDETSESTFLEKPIIIREGKTCLNEQQFLL